MYTSRPSRSDSRYSAPVNGRFLPFTRSSGCCGIGLPSHLLRTASIRCYHSRGFRSQNRCRRIGADMIIENQASVTDAVVEAFGRTADPRLREILLALVRHLHGFIREVKLTEREFQEATRLIAALGQKTTDSHNEVVLMAGSLGVSALVCLLNNGDNGQTETQANLLGPFWRDDQPLCAD